MAGMKKIAIVVPPSVYTAPFGWEHAASAPLEGATIAAHVVRGLSDVKRSRLIRKLLKPLNLSRRKFIVETYDLRVSPEARAEIVEHLATFYAICIAGTPDSYPFVKQFTWQVASANAGALPRIIVGGPLATFSTKTVLENAHVECCIMGECELALPAVLLTSAPEASKYFSVAYGNSPAHGLEWNSDSPDININNELLLPPPAYRDIWPGRYAPDEPIPLVYYATQRGCPNKCTFCVGNDRKMGRWRGAIEPDG